MTDRRRSGELRGQPRMAQARPIAGRETPRREVPDEPSGLRIGGVRIAPTAVLLVIALVGSLGYFLYAVSVHDASQIPMLVSGAVVLGVVFVAIAVTGLIATWRSSVRGRDGRALGHALVGGVACLAAAASFAGAIILGMVSDVP
jgi:hypothetical protein